MKKFFITMIVALTAMVATAQETMPNRMIVHKGAWDYKGFAIDKVDSISFARLDGEVKATIDFQEFKTGETGDTIILGVTRSEQCYKYYIDVLPTNTVSRYDDDALASYFESGEGSGPYYQGFQKAVMTGFETPFQDNTSYTIFTVAYDKYGVACEASRAEFTTPRTPLVGNPTVAWTLDEATATTLTMTFTPSADTKGYSFCLFDKGQAEEQFQMWGPMMGLTSMGDMIKMFCQQELDSVYTFTWTDENPGTEYEVYIQPWDINGTYADMIIANVSTTKQGGEGIPEVAITVKDFGGDSINGYWQNVLYTPNDQVSLFHDAIVNKAYYDDGTYNDSLVAEVLKNEDPYWAQYKVDDAYWNAKPSTTYYAVAIAQNINGEWGPMAKVEFSTPTAPDAPAASKAKRAGSAPAMAQRIVKSSKKGGLTLRPACAPAINTKASKGLKLVTAE